jgi:hypothetical protein
MLARNRTLTSVNLFSNNSGDEGTKSMLSMLEKNYSLMFVAFNLQNIFIAGSTNRQQKFIYKYLQRNKSLQWKVIHLIIVDICFASYALELPNYVLLEIIDWFPFWEVAINRYKKITLIENVNRSIRKILEKRETDNKEIKIN